MEETLKLIDDRIGILEEALTVLAPGSNEFDLVQKQITELIKLRASISEKEIANEIDVREKRKDRWTRVVIAGAEISIPLIVYSKLWKQGLAFEKEGILTSTSVKNLFQRFKFF
jgi:hypothetical protein